VSEEGVELEDGRTRGRENGRDEKKRAIGQSRPLFRMTSALSATPHPLPHDERAERDSPRPSTHTHAPAPTAELGGTVISTRAADCPSTPPPGITHVAAWHAADPAALVSAKATPPPLLVSPVWVWQCAAVARAIPPSADRVYRPLAFPTIAGAGECEVTLSGFVGDFRALVLEALAATGVVATKAMSTATATHVVCPDVDDATSAKIARAKSPACAARIAVVNPAWLWDSLRHGRVMPAAPYVYNLLHGPEPVDSLEEGTSGEGEAEAAAAVAVVGAAGAAVPAAGATLPAPAAAAGTKRAAPAEARRLRFTQVSAGEGDDPAGPPDENAAPQPAAKKRGGRGGGTGLKGGAPPADAPSLPPPTLPTETQTHAALGAASGFAAQLVAARPTQAHPLAGAWMGRARAGGGGGVCARPVKAPQPPPQAAAAAEAGASGPGSAPTTVSAPPPEPEAEPEPEPAPPPPPPPPRARARPRPTGQGPESARARPGCAQPEPGARALARPPRPAPAQAGASPVRAGCHGCCYCC